MKLLDAGERIQVLNCSTSIQNVIKDITKSAGQEDPFYVCDIGDIIRKHKEWKTKLPRIDPFYAIKCNDVQIVLELMIALGVGFDCASKNEISKILQYGVDPNQIVFANPAKPASHIKYAATNGVGLMTFDNDIELHKIKTYYPSARLILRFRCDDILAQCPLGFKYGCDAELDGPRLLQAAKNLNLNVIGFSFHVGSGCNNPSIFSKAIKIARTLFDIAVTFGHKPNLLDIGGGFPGNKGTSLDKIAQTINHALDEWFPDPAIKIIAEPGRYYVASAFTLMTGIHSKREIFDADGSVTRIMYYINDGVYSSFNCLLYDHAEVTAIPLNSSLCPGKLISSSIWGPTCDSLDRVVDNVPMHEMFIGDWIKFENMGAYTIPIASSFNGFPTPRIFYFVDQNSWKMVKDVFPLTEDHFITEAISSINTVNKSENWEVDCSLENSFHLTEDSQNNSAFFIQFIEA